MEVCINPDILHETVLVEEFRTIVYIKCCTSQWVAIIIS